MMLALFLGMSAQSQALAGSDVRFFVMVKSSNYAQAEDGSLSLLNYHFFSEIFPLPHGQIHGASLKGEYDGAGQFEYSDRGANFYFEGGHFDSLAAVDAEYPNGFYLFSIRTARQGEIAARLELAGPGGETDIPEPIHIKLSQGMQVVSPIQIDPLRDLVISWNDYSNGRDDPRGIVDDMIFVVVADCFGERIFHTGLPFSEEPYLRHDERAVRVAADLLRPGEPYSMFVEFPHVVDSVRVDDTPGFTSYATATYLDLRTVGSPGRSCPDAQPPMDTGQTDRMEVEVTPQPSDGD